MSLKTRTAVKLLLSILLFSGILIAGLVLPCFITASTFIIFMGFFAAGFLDIGIMMHYFPIWFKDYIDYDNKKKGGVKNEEEVNIKETTKPEITS